MKWGGSFGPRWLYPSRKDGGGASTKKAPTSYLTLAAPSLYSSAPGLGSAFPPSLANLSTIAWNTQFCRDLSDATSKYQGDRSMAYSQCKPGSLHTPLSTRFGGQKVVLGVRKSERGVRVYADCMIYRPVYPSRIQGLYPNASPSLNRKSLLLQWRLSVVMRGVRSGRRSSQGRGWIMIPLSLSRSISHPKHGVVWRK